MIRNPFKYGKEVLQLDKRLDGGGVKVMLSPREALYRISVFPRGNICR